jgi:hypothetical protein
MGDEECVTVQLVAETAHALGDWRDFSCDALRPYVCEAPLPPDATCDSLDGGVVWICPTRLSWDDAQASCDGALGSLVRIGDAVANTALVDAADVATLPVASAWIGLRRVDTSGWQWTDGTRIGAPLFSAWEIGEPNSSGDEDCLAIKTDAVESYESWVDAGCGTARGVICDGVQNPGICDPISGTTLCVTDISETYDEAALLCAKLGGTLARINSHADNELLFFALQAISPSAKYWLHASDAVAEGQWRWLDNGDLLEDLAP